MGLAKTSLKVSNSKKGNYLCIKQNSKKFFAALCCFNLSAYAAELPAPSYNTYNTIERATGKLNITIPAYTTKKASSSFPLESGESVTINASYSPSSARVDFGLIGSDGKFHYVSASNGSINCKINISERGNYTLAIRNNSSNSVQVTGYVTY